MGTYLEGKNFFLWFELAFGRQQQGTAWYGTQSITSNMDGLYLCGDWEERRTCFTSEKAMHGLDGSYGEYRSGTWHDRDRVRSRKCMDWTGWMSMCIDWDENW